MRHRPPAWEPAYIEFFDARQQSFMRIAYAIERRVQEDVKAPSIDEADRLATVSFEGLTAVASAERLQSPPGE